MSNVEKQLDEVLALQSIFENKFRRLDETQYEILVEFELPPDFTVRLDDRIAHLRYIPPLSLIIHIHEEYPNESPPSYLLSCFYLSRQELSDLCVKLDHSAFIPGEVCVYDWIEILRQAISDQLILQRTRDDDVGHTVDPRALNAYRSGQVDRIYQNLLDYNQEREQELFRNQLQTCLICAETVSGQQCIRLQRCGHFYCLTCLNHYVRTTLDNGKFGEKVHCPEEQCRQALLPTEIKQVIRDEQLYERYERLTLQHGLETMNDIVWCPRCQLSVLAGSGDDNLAMCDRCRYTFCKKCKELYHSQSICPKDYAAEMLKLKHKKEVERLEKAKEVALAQWEKAQEQKKSDSEQTLAKLKYRQIVMSLSEQDALLEEVLTAQRLHLMNAQPCPKCHIPIEKNGGCSHMYCTRCKTHFNWQTVQSVSTSTAAPFLEENGQNFIQLEAIKTLVSQVLEKVEPIEDQESTTVPSNEPTEEVKFTINNRSTIGAIIVQRVQSCPRKGCARNNVKIRDDNWMVCERCMKQYCFVCSGSVNDGKHFEKKCPRFTSIE